MHSFISWPWSWCPFVVVEDYLRGKFVGFAAAVAAICCGGVGSYRSLSHEHETDGDIPPTIYWFIKWN